MADPGASITAWAVFSAIGGSITGSIVGGLINFAFQKKQQRDQRRALAFSLLVKLVKISSNLQNLGRAIPSEVPKDENGNNISPWQYVLPIVNLPEPVRFTPDELSVAMYLSDDLFNSIADLDELHQSALILFSAYAKSREEIKAKIPAKMDGRVGTSTLSQEQYDWLAPRIIEMNDTIQAMKTFTQKDGPIALDATFRLQSLMARKLRVTKTMQLKK